MTTKNNHSFDLSEYDASAARRNQLYDDGVQPAMRVEYKQTGQTPFEYDGAPAWMYTVIVLATVAMCGGGCGLLWWLAI